MIVEFTAVGRPAGMGSLRAIPVRRKNGARSNVVIHASTRTRPWQAVIADAAAAAMGGRLLLREAVLVDAVFTFQRPQGHYGTGRNRELLRPSADLDPVSQATGDLDKLCRAILDAMQGVVYANDSQVVDLRASKRYGTPEGASVAVLTVQPDPPVTDDRHDPRRGAAPRP